jgi:protocatechuate 3,4-dioxygenase beta subunit
MTDWTRNKLTRRTFLAGSAAAAAALAACSDDDGDPAATATRESTAGDAAPTSVTPSGAAQTTTPSGRTLAPTPSCTDDDDVTPEQTAGPFFTPDSPERASLRDAGLAGTPLVVSGFVLSTDCTPVAGALLDFWQADDNGNYDNEGYTLRGHQFSGDDGSYRLETIMPGLYPGRTRHIHVNVQAPDSAVLTSQLYFPGEAQNATDGIFDEALVMAVRDDGAGKAAAFDFVLDVA